MAETNEEITDPGLYRRLSEPFPSVEAANAAIREFNKELRALREKHKIRDIHAVVCGSYLTPEGDEAGYMLDIGHGDEMKAESMLAWAFGRAQAERQERISYAIEQAIQRPKRGK